MGKKRAVPAVSRMTVEGRSYDVAQSGRPQEGRGSWEAGDGVVDWPSVDRWGRARRGPWIGSRLGMNGGADVTGR